MSVADLLTQTDARAFLSKAFDMPEDDTVGLVKKAGDFALRRDELADSRESEAQQWRDEAEKFRKAAAVLLDHAHSELNAAVLPKAKLGMGVAG